MSFTFAFDAIAADYGNLPAGYQVAGYDTGGPGYAWTDEMWAEHPGAVHIDQDPAAGNSVSDVLDCESGAVPVGTPKIPAWVKSAQASWGEAKRPGQRRPALYCSASNVTANVNALVSGGVSSGAGLWIASWGIGTANAVAELASAAGPFPVIGIQFAGGSTIDTDVFSTAWLDDVSGKPQPPSGDWTFGPVTGFELVNYGPRSLEVTFSAPWGFLGVPPVPAPGVTGYEMAVCLGRTLSRLAPGYPRYLGKGSNPETWEEGGLEPGTTYTVAVRARRALNDGHAGPWVTAPFTTPAG